MARPLSPTSATAIPPAGTRVLGSVGWLSGQNLLWLYAPFQAAELAFAALVLAFLARSAGLSRPAAAVTGWLAAIPALVYSYALMGSIKEITVLPMLLLMGACVVLAPRLARAGVRGALPFAIAGAASLGAIGIAASPWVGLLLLAVLAFAAPVVMLRRHRARALALSAVVTGGMTAVLALPTLGPLSTTLALAQNVSSTDAQAASDPGNLLRPLRIAQAFGIWLGESHRIEPRFLNQTYLVIGVVAVCAILGRAVAGAQAGVGGTRVRAHLRRRMGVLAPSWDRVDRCEGADGELSRGGARRADRGVQHQGRT